MTKQLKYLMVRFVLSAQSHWALRGKLEKRAFWKFPAIYPLRDLRYAYLDIHNETSLSLRSQLNSPADLLEVLP